jgi:hypothetical protein
MLKAQIAEWILSLVTTRELAASTAGDWLEEVPARGSLWFWSSVLRTAFSFVWRDITTAPFRLATLALCALFLGSALSFILLIGSSIVSMTLIRIDIAVLPPGALKYFTISQWSTGLAGTTVLVMAVQFQIGRWISRHARGREGWKRPGAALRASRLALGDRRRALGPQPRICPTKVI